MSDEELKRSLQREGDALRQARDELKLQLHLGKAEVKEEWDKLERKWAQVESELARVGAQAKEPMQKIGHAARDLMGELRSGYSRIREQLRD